MTSATKRKLRLVRSFFLPAASFVVLLVLGAKLARHNLSTRDLWLLTVAAITALAVYGVSLFRASSRVFLLPLLLGSAVAAGCKEPRPPAPPEPSCLPAETVTRLHLLCERAMELCLQSCPREDCSSLECGQAERLCGLSATAAKQARACRMPKVKA